MTSEISNAPSQTPGSYAGDRVIYDADSHVFEDPDFYKAFAEPGLEDTLPEIFRGGFTEEGYRESVSNRSPEPPTSAAELLSKRLWSGHGAFDPEERSLAMDLLGFRGQLVFDSFFRSPLAEAEREGDMDRLHALAKTHNRALIAFCEDDSRLLPAGYLPMADLERVDQFAAEAIDLGCRALQIAADCPPGHSPSHAALDPVWERLAEAGVPLVLHLAGGRLPTTDYRRNGRDREQAFYGGDGPITSFEYLAAANPVMEILSVLAIDGVFDRIPNLRVMVLEYGACWVPGFLRFLDSAQIAFSRAEKRLQAQSLKLSESVRRAVRVGAFTHEDLKWILGAAEGACDDMFMFFSDYPHIEGNRDPIAKFDAHLVDASPATTDKFYRGNFVDALGGTVG